jgi:[ribosomal protein S18]-alanine N-acetyltransferase
MINKAKTTDLHQIVGLEKKVFNETLGIEFLHFELTENPYALMYVYHINQQVVGYIGIRILDQNAEMMNFVVDPLYQGQGIGEKLLNEVMKTLKENNVEMLSLEVRRHNQKAISFYEKHHFQVSHIRKNYYQNEDAIVYIRKVT